MRVQRAADVVFEILDGKAILVDADGLELITLNLVGTVVWEALTEPIDSASLAEQLAENFEDVAFETLERDIATFLDELHDLGLVVEVRRPGPRHP
jgi:hypothetical protein